jgi:hypothetical protein
VAVCIFALAAGCAGSGADGKPTAALSPSVEDEGAFRKLQGTFARASRGERVAMAGGFEAFRQAHPNDPLARFAEVYLAWIALEKGQNQVAEILARKAQGLTGAGTAGDIARAVEGAAIRRQERPDQALLLLSPLVSKLIDAHARALFNEEIVESALQARRWERALELMSVWLREAGADERMSVRARIEQNLERVPAAALGKMLDRARGIELALAAEEEVEIRKLVARRLAVVARAAKDSELAQRLLQRSGALLGDQADPIAALAAGAGRARVEPRTVGLLLSLRSDRTRRRVTEIASGVAFGLGLPGSAARLVSRDDHGSLDRINDALAALSADGASIIIAGTDEQEANAAAAFAETRQIPVLLLRPASAQPEGSKSRFTFVVGPGPAEVEDALVSALASRGAAPLALLADEPIHLRAPRPEVTHVRGCAEAGASWKPLGVGGVLLFAPPDCAREAIVAAARLKLRFAVGPGADPLPLPAGSVVATAGLYPILPGDPLKGLEGWLKDHPTPPSWWAALGHDAAVLAWAGVEALPGTEDPREVAARRARAASALAAARADLWTTGAQGFGGGRALPRTLGIREQK